MLCLLGQVTVTMGTVRDLHDFLEEAELLHYYSALCNQLRISTVPQLKYVEEEDLAGIGMSKPEMRRLKKLYKKECPHGALGKIKKVKVGNRLMVAGYLLFLECVSENIPLSS